MPGRRLGDVVDKITLFDALPRMAAAVNLEGTEVVLFARGGFLKRPNEINPAIRRMLQVMAGPVSSKSNQFMKQKDGSR